MVFMTQSMEQFLWQFHRDKIGLILLGHTELFTKEMSEEYINWCRSDEGRKYLAGGSEYDPNHIGNKKLDEMLSKEDIV